MSKKKGTVTKKIEQKIKDYFAKIKLLNDIKQHSKGTK